MEASLGCGGLHEREGPEERVHLLPVLTFGRGWSLKAAAFLPTSRHILEHKSLNPTSGCLWHFRKRNLQDVPELKCLWSVPRAVWGTIDLTRFGGLRSVRYRQKAPFTP